MINHQFEKKLVINIDDEVMVKRFYHRFRLLKIISRPKKIKVEVNFDKMINAQDKNDIDQMIHALNIKNKKERLEFIYSQTCKNLDEKFANANFCEFKNDRCLAQANSNKAGRINGCCGQCKYLTRNGCEIDSLACKLYFCSKIKKAKHPVKVKDIKLLHYFLTFQQKYILTADFFKNKEETLKDLYRNSIFIWAFKRSKQNW